MDKPGQDSTKENKRTQLFREAHHQSLSNLSAIA
jgi:hypothetical protein